MKSRSPVDDKNSIDALRKIKTNLDNALRIANLGAFEWDIKSDTLIWTDETYRIFGQDRNSFTPSADNFYQQVHPDDRDRVYKNSENALGGEVYEITFRAIRPDGEECILQEQAQIYLDADGQPETMHGVISDITERETSQARILSLNNELKLRLIERKELISTLESKNADLTQKNTELERYAYTVSHDLKNPLFTIKGYVGLIRKSVLHENSQETGDFLQVIDNAADKMYRLLDGLLEIAKVGLKIGKKEEIDLNQLLDAVLPNNEKELIEIDVNFETQKDMPTVIGDPVRLAEVYQNLLENSIKFRLPDTPLNITIGATPRNEFVLCWLSDNGIGIEAEYHEKIFTIFERLENSTEGSGLGLALCQQIIESHGGRIWVESKGLNQGSTFFFTLPRAEPIS